MIYKSRVARDDSVKIEGILEGMVVCMWKYVFLLLVTCSAFAQESTMTFPEAYAEYQSFAAGASAYEALPYAKLAYELGEPLYGSDHENTAILAYNYGSTLLETNHYAEAEKILAIAYDQYQKIYGKKAFELIGLLMMRGHASAVPDQRPKRKFYDKAIKLAKAKDDRMLLAALNYSAGVRLTEQAKSLNGHEYLKKAYGIYEADLGLDSARTIGAAFYLGKIEMGRLNNNAAKKLFLQVIHALDPDQDMTLMSHALLVPLYRQEGDADGIIEHCQAVSHLQMWNQICGPNAQTTKLRHRAFGTTNVHSAHSVDLEDIPDDVKKSYVRDAFSGGGHWTYPR